MKYLLIALLKLYRLLISPLYGNVCRYYPSCSAYALESVRVHGSLRGAWYSGYRLARCNPWSLGGYDPVPGTLAAQQWAAEQAQQSTAQASHADPDHIRAQSAATAELTTTARCVR